MALKAHRVRLGFFFVLIMGLFIGSIVWLTGGFSTTASTSYACYFGWSVGGLNVGSAVNYNGVPVGSVTDIEIAPDGRLVKVTLRIDDDKFMVDETIVASLYITGITGLQNVNLESLPESELRLWRQEELSFQSDLEVIPVRSGTVQSVTTGMNRVLEMLNQVDVKQLNDQTIMVLTRMNQLLDDLQADSLSCRLTEALESIDRLLTTYNNLGIELTEAVQQFRGEVEPVAEDIHRFTNQLLALGDLLHYIADDLDDTFRNTGVILNEISIMLPRLNRLLEGSSSASGEDIWR